MTKAPGTLGPRLKSNTGPDFLTVEAKFRIFAMGLRTESWLRKDSSGRALALYIAMGRQRDFEMPIIIYSSLGI